MYRFPFPGRQPRKRMHGEENMGMYAVFSLAIMNYVGAVSCTVIAVTTAISLIRAKTEPTK